ncbi:MAG: ATP-binding protein [Planctomycetes bacterium]|nr:ATP-binding protein [Planctomycetota bacterium]
MIFGGKPPEEVTDDELRRLVTEHVGEKQSVEFKATYATGTDESRLEILQDLVSFANAAGGYVIVGIRDDGTGRAHGWSQQSVAAIRTVAHSVQQSAHDGIADRIPDLRMQVRHIDGNGVLLIQVPESDRKPHMVKLLRSTRFVMRYGDGKREMTLSEIREAFLTRESESLKAMLQGIVTPVHAQSLSEKVELLWEDGISESNDPGVIRHGLIAHLRQARAASLELRLIHIPDRPAEIRAVTDAPPPMPLLGMRDSGWNFRRSMQSLRPVAGGWTSTELPMIVEQDTPDMNGRRQLDIYRNGVIVAVVPVHDSISWKQSRSRPLDEPELYPYAIIEYPLSFAALVRSLYDGLPDGTRHGKIHMEYNGVEKATLRAYRPGIIAYEFSHDVRPLGQPKITLTTPTIGEFDVNDVTFRLVEPLYAAFGHDKSRIPLWDTATRTFVMPD